MNPSGCVVARHSPDLADELWQLVEELRGADVLAPVTVVTPTRYAGTQLRHRLGPRGFANIRFCDIGKVSDVLGRPEMARQGRRPLTKVIEGALLRKVIGQSRQPLSQVSEHPAALSSLRYSFRELRLNDKGVQGTLEQMGGLSSEVVRLYSIFRREVDRYWYDDEDLAEAAAEAVDRDGSGAGADLGRIVLYLPRNPSPAQARLIEALNRHGRCAVMLGLTGDESADAPVLDLSQALGVSPQGQGSAGGHAGQSPLPPGEASLHIAPSAHEEIRWVIRRMLERAESEGTPFHRMAILYRADSPYAKLIPTELMLAGIPVAGHDRATLADTGAGRTLMGLVRMSGGPLDRAEMMEWLTGCPVRAGGVNPAYFSPSRWDRLSKKAGIVGGLTEWNERLSHYGRQLAKDAESGIRNDVLSDGRAAWMRGEAAEAERIRSFVKELASDLDPPTSGGSWKEFCSWALGLLETYLDPLPEYSDLEGLVVRDGGDRVRSAVEELGAADDISDSTTLDEFRRALEDMLSGPADPLGATGTGVFVSSFGAAYGMSFDAVWMVGMIEGRAPPAVRSDPLLPDRQMRAAGGRSRVKLRPAQDRYDYLAALACSKVRTLSYPGVDGGSRREAYPSRWFLEQATALEGSPVRSGGIKDLSERSWLTVTASAIQALSGADDETFADAGDYTVARLLEWRDSGRRQFRHPIVRNGPLDRAGRLTYARGFGGLSEFSGDLSSVAANSRLREKLESGAVSATSLEAWATCPFRYFLGQVLRLAVVDTPEEVMSITALERGSLIHVILERFIFEEQAKGRLPSSGGAWSEEARGRLIEVAREEFAAAEKRGITGKRALWDMEKQDIETDLHIFLEEDTNLRAENGTASIQVEAGFGFPNTPEVNIELEDGRRLSFRGKADRIDVSADGSRALVVDYKTGGSRMYRALDDDIIDGGKRLQLGIYSLAARTFTSAAARIRAAYWFPTTRGGFRLAPGSYFDLEDQPTNERFRHGLSTIADGIRSGLFPANPGPMSWGGRTNCRFCEFDTLCPTGRGDAWDAASNDPKLVEYVRLAE